MIAIAKGLREGKTTELIKLSADTWQYMVVPTPREFWQLAQLNSQSVTYATP